MRVEEILLEDFRNYRKQELAFRRGLNVVVGRNAQGKTNLLEAVQCLSGMGSPRAENAALVREGTEAAFIHADVIRGGRMQHVDMELRPGRGTRFLLNRTPMQRAKALPQLPVTVFFGPDELSLVKGGPDGRRRFLDELIVKLRPARDSLRRDLERVLKQRNALLRSMRTEGRTDARERLEVWDAALCTSGAALASARLAVLADLTPFAHKRYEEVAGGGALELAYVGSWLPGEDAAAAIADPSTIDEGRLASHIQRRIEELRIAELERGQTLVGPQRDDVSVKLAARTGDVGGMLDARMYASQGDQRTSALALKLAEHDLVTERLDDPPLLLLDDVFSELDAERRKWLAVAVGETEQTIVSSAEPGVLEPLDPALVVEVESGIATIR